MTKSNTDREQTDQRTEWLGDQLDDRQSRPSRRDILKGIGAASVTTAAVGLVPSSVAGDDLPTSSAKGPTWTVAKHDRNIKRSATARNYELGAVLRYEDYDSERKEHTFTISWSGFCTLRGDNTRKSSGIGGQFMHVVTPNNVTHRGPKGDTNKQGIGPVDRNSEYDPEFGTILALAVGAGGLPRPLPFSATMPGWLLVGSEIVKEYLFRRGGEKPDGYWIHESYTDASRFEIIHGERVNQAFGFSKEFRLEDPSPNGSKQPVVRIAVGEGEFGGTGELVSEPPGDIDYGRQYLEKQALTDNVLYQGDKGAGVEFKLHLDGSDGVSVESSVESPVFEPIYDIDSTAAEYDKNTDGLISSNEVDEALEDWNNDEITTSECINVIGAHNRTESRKMGDTYVTKG